MTSPAPQQPENQAKRACLSCRRQKRWCDKTLPHCLACVKARRHCEGYASEAVRTFVNTDATNVSRRKRRLLCEAIAKSKDQDGSTPSHKTPYDVVGLEIETSAFSTSYRFDIVAITSLQPDFGHHAGTLWDSFCHGYCTTDDYWPPGCSLLLQSFHNRVLDLSLIALSAQRLALDNPAGPLQSMSLTAYNDSIALYRRLMQQPCDLALNAMLAVVSTVYALMEASLMQPDDIASFGWGPSGHLDGAFALMQRCGPDFFAAEGLHLVFKKIREMGLYLALVRHEKTFLAEEKWMTCPWKLKPKTWRDRLHDIALRFSEISSRLWTNEQSTPPTKASNNMTQQILDIEVELSDWRLAWLDSQDAHLGDTCVCQMPAVFSCICTPSTPKTSDPNFNLLLIECWAIQLVISITLLKWTVPLPETEVTWAECLSIRSSQIALNIEAALNDWASRRPNAISSGITEDVCRTILANWAVKDYKTALSTSALS